MAEEADDETGLRPYDRVLPDMSIMQVEKEMLFCSRRPAIGLRWFLEYGNEVYPSDFVVMDGKEFRPPKYYDKIIKEHRPDIWEKVLNARLEHVENSDDLTDERREAICRARESRRKQQGERDAI